MAEVEHDVRHFIIDDRYEQKVKDMFAEGWMMDPLVPPVAVFHVQRMKQEPASVMAGKVKVSIDDNKVFTLKADGSIQLADGTILPPGSQVPQ